MNATQHFQHDGLNLGRMLSYSKSAYAYKYPSHQVYFNANIFTESEGKVWYGDLDLTFDTPRLAVIAKACGEPLYVLREMDGRFENENISATEMKAAAVAVIHNT
jgi:hypothetical protein